MDQHQLTWALIDNSEMYLFVPWLPVGIRLTAETGQELLLHLSRVKLGQTAQVEICKQAGKQ